MYWPGVLGVLLLLTHNTMASGVPVPDGGSTSVLALIVVAGVALLRRKLH